MREILFRGKNITTGKWRYGRYVQQTLFKTGSCKECVHWIIGEYGYEMYKIAPRTLGQYTGIDGKDKVKIFEGDILKIPSKALIYNIGYVRELLGIVRWDKEEASFYIESALDFYGMDEIMPEKTEVIGNKWDNPELLKEMEVQ